MTYLRTISTVVGSVLANRSLRRVQIAFAAFNGSEWGVWIAMLVYAYERGGATTAGLVAVAQLIPAGLFAPFAATLVDRHPPAKVLALSYLAQGLALAVTAAALLGGAAPLVAYALAAIAATAVTITRPTQAALLPALAQTADELTASNVVSGWIESASVLVAPALAGVLIAVGGPGAVFAVMAVLVLGGAALVSGVRAPRPARVADPEGSVLRETVRGFGSLAHDAPSRLLVGVLGAQFVVIGALDVLFVVLAVDVLDLGGSGAAYLNAMFGAGGVVGVVATVALVGRARLAPPLLLGLVVWSAAFVALAAFPSTPGALVLLAVAGAGRTLLDVAGRTLLQRAAPSEVLGRVFGVLEGITMGALALGSILAPAFVGLVGPRWATACAGGILPLAVIGVVPRLRRVDGSAT
ncbi:MAG: MFS transporter, partial [Actinobacteria bacterium]|nr:MFS transporter [Actinomycetota bacterium]